MELLNRNVAITVQVEGENGIQTLSATLHLMKKEIEALREHSEQQEQFNQELLMGLEKQQKYIDDKLEKRDRLLMQSIKESMEARQQAAVASSSKNGQRTSSGNLNKL